MFRSGTSALNPRRHISCRSELFSSTFFCAESLGETTRETRFQRNRVYVREERVGGSKTSDDTFGSFFCFSGVGRL